MMGVDYALNTLYYIIYTSILGVDIMYYIYCIIYASILSVDRMYCI